jgi:hypothetical protein
VAVVAAVVSLPLELLVTVAQALSSFLMLVLSNLVAVSSHLLAVTLFTHS